ncbi:hypothetical protein JD969_05115 [Planctomycetota bacterium]|nr:hypothetical protein JD969_05115 [Planctomycetota bacterium]
METHAINKYAVFPLLALFGIATSAQAATVSGNFTVSGGIHFDGESFAPGGADIGDTGSFSFDLNLDAINAGYQDQGGGIYEYENAFDSFVFEVNGESFDLISGDIESNILQVEQDQSGFDVVEFDIETDLGRVFFRLGYDDDVLTFDENNAFNLDIFDENLIGSIPQFSFYDGFAGGTSLLQVEFDGAFDTDLPPAAVPTPAAFASSVLLIPLLLRRKRDKS